MSVKRLKKVPYKGKIRAEDDNAIVDNFKGQLSLFNDLSNRMKDPDFAELVEELKKIVSQMWYVKAGDPVQSKLHNLFVDAWNKQIEINENVLKRLAFIPKQYYYVLAKAKARVLASGVEKLPYSESYSVRILMAWMYVTLAINHLTNNKLLIKGDFATGSILYIIVVSGANFTSNSAKPIVADVDADGENEIVAYDGGNGLTRIFRGIDGSEEATISPAFLGFGFNSKYLVGYDGSYLYCYDTSLSLVWQRSLEKSGVNAVIGVNIYDVDNDGVDEILVTDDNGYLYCIDIRDGSIKWSYRFYSGTGVTRIYDLPSIGDVNGDGEIEIVFADTYSRYCHCLKYDGTLVWKSGGDLGYGSGTGNVSQSISESGLIIVAHDSGNVVHLRRLDPSNGSQIYDVNPIDERFYPYWNGGIGDVDGDGVLEVADVTFDSPIFFIINAENGSLKASYDVGGGTADAGAHVYLCDCDDDGKLEGISQIKYYSTNGIQGIYVIEDTFSSLKWKYTWSDGANTRFAFFVGDVDNDGKAEIVAVGDTVDKITVFKG